MKDTKELTYALQLMHSAGDSGEPRHVVSSRNLSLQADILEFLEKRELALSVTKFSDTTY